MALKNCLLVGRSSKDVKPVLLHAIEALGSRLSVFCDLGESDKSPQVQLAELIESHAFDWVVVVGGDGTLHLTVDVLQAFGQQIPILLIPSGTANDFARTVVDYIQTTESPAIIQSGSHNYIQSDVGVVVSDDTARLKHFINMLVIGPSAEHSLTISTDLKQIVGSVAYLTQLYHSLVTAGGFALSISVDGRPSERFTCSAVFVANGKTCGGGYSVVPHADPTDGYLDVVIVKEIGIWEKLKLATSFVSDQHLNNDAVQYYRAQKIDLQFEKPQSLTLDGECSEAEKISIRAANNVQPLVVTSVQDLHQTDWQEISECIQRAVAK